jgi:hypothetical protein
MGKAPLKHCRIALAGQRFSRNPGPLLEDLLGTA